MKISIERTALLRAVGHAQSVVERRNTIPILANVLLSAEGDTASFRATDLDVEVVDRAPAQVETPGAATASAVTLHEIVRKLPDGALVELAAKDGRLEVSAGRSRFQLATLPKEDFPDLATPEYQSEFTIPAKDLRRLFDKSQFAISTEETRYYLNGVYLHVTDGGGEGGKSLRAVATDGHRLARVDAEIPLGAEDMPGVIVPRKTVAELRKLLTDEEAVIKVSVSEAKIRFATDDMTLTSKVIDGTFPDYTRVIPSGNARRLELDASDFAKAVDRVATVSSERSRAVKMQLTEDRLVLSVNAPDAGAAEEELAVAYGDERLEIGFNAKYLLEIAQQVERENAVFLFNSAGDPALVREGGDESAVYVVMPMRV